ncbi:DDE-type integrase/transposase/recombinase [Planococcus massiliensis]|nr:DDE-type integrase/transposase/recombinase [Planococcus massiliensis]
MNLNNLKTTVPAKLYKRGLDYFEQDFIEQLTEDAPNRWHALVMGTRDYEVSVNLTKDGTIVGSYCTCPFESDSLCKHEVAVCLAICEYKKENSSSAVDVQARLKTLKKVELLEILEELVEKQPTVQLYLAEKFANPNGMDEEKARRLIQKSAYRASRSGFIEWDRTDQALEGVWGVLEYLDGLNSQHDAERIIRLSLIIVKECTEMLQIADDSSGGISSAIYESLDKISEALAKWPEDLDEATVDDMLVLLYPHILFALEQDVTDAASHLVEAVLQWNERGGFTEKFYNFIAFILSHSRYKYVEWLDRPFRTADVVRCHENAFTYYEGMPVEMVYDQDALLAVSENAGDLILTAEFTKYQAARGFKIYLCRKSDPESKGKIEQVVKFVKYNFSKNRVFDQLDSWNEASLAWLKRTGNHKVHHNIKKRPSEVHALEKQHLRKVSTTYLFENTLTSSITRKIHKDNVIRYLQNRYSVPSGTYQEGSANKAYLQLGEDQTFLIRLKPTGPVLAKHELSAEKGLVISDPLHRAKSESKRSLLIHQLADAFSNQEDIQWFIKALTEKYPRHLIDQLKVIQKAIRDHPNSAGSALKEVRKLQLISGNDFRDIAYSLDLQVQQPPAPEIQLNQKYMALKAPERSSDTYLKVLSGGRMR